MPPRKSSRQTSKETTNEDVQILQQPHKEADQWIYFINSERIIEVIFFEHPLWLYDAVPVYFKYFQVNRHRFIVCMFNNIDSREACYNFVEVIFIELIMFDIYLYDINI